MNILPVVSQIIMLFLLMGTGLFARKKDFLSDASIQCVNRLLLGICWPMLMIVTTQRDCTPEALHDFLLIFVATLAVTSIGCLLCYYAFRRQDKGFRATMSMLSTMPNAGFFGIPIVQALYGDGALLYLAAYIIAFNVVIWTVGISTFTGFNRHAFKNLLNPGLMLGALGFALFLAQIRLPGPVLGAMQQLAAVNTPLSMLLIGARMEGMKPGQLLDGRMWITVFIKLLAMPLLALFALRALGITGMPLMILTVGTALPGAATTQMMTERYGGNTAFTAKGTSVGTLCSLVSIPLVVWIAGLIA